MGYTVALVARLSRLSVPKRAPLMPRIPRLPKPSGGDTGMLDGAGPVLHVALLGESSAAGIGAATVDEALVGRLATRAAQITGRAVSWRLIARSGAVTATVRRELVPQLTEEATGWTPDAVVVVVGINDLIRLTMLKTWRRQVAQLITAIHERVGECPILVAGLPPVHRVPTLPSWLRFLAGRRARQMDGQLAEVAHASGAHHQPVLNLPCDDTYFAGDGFHPSPLCYGVWGDLLATKLAEILSSSAHEPIREPEPASSSSRGRVADADQGRRERTP